ncbi:MAG: nucleotidyltransferase domain-containing protein [Candidatus Baltobacteraceae bacterium]
MQSYEVRCATRRAHLEAAVAEFVALCAERSDICEAFVFGSFARDEVGPHSDLDVLVIRQTDAPRLSRGDDLLVARKSAIPIDLIVLRPDEYAKRLELTGFGKTILAEARKIYAT